MEIVYTKQTSGFEAGKRYRNPAYFQGLDKEAGSVTVIGNYPRIVEAYKAAGIEVYQRETTVEKPIKSNDMKVEQLKETLAAKGIEFSDNAKKADLVKLLEEAGGA